MKVVLFCGGLGMRLHPATEQTPKPMIPIGQKPLILHLMRYYAYFGHKDFVLCLGYKGEEIKKFFIDYYQCLTSDFVLSKGGKKRRLLKSEIEDWTITFVDTGLNSNVGQRLKSVQKHLNGEEMFLANYSDGLTDFHLPSIIDFSIKKGIVGCFLAVRPFYVFHMVSIGNDGCVRSLRSASKSNLRINGGFFVFQNKIFDYIENGEDLVDEPFQRLIKERQLFAYKYDGFWASLDTYKDKQRLDDMISKGTDSWEIWKNRDY